ncbi:Trk system potassium transporter TrkA [Hyphobacterium sp. HN65]|uniref:Trk system potassium uptake protein TrkA n=1 Tax=Hyphobacterium lacteum TaxID=3116575 RepID=A0ABU7LLZ4_9PROT|nr:Trk system potassium transporter TrkA [Hyphobacterium sp. HN65]MEE2524946.1 Trk system potassium transporter TrkA [Hyphobacterium sp. HN65]
MKAVVCGAGRVGYGIAKALSREGNSVTVVDWSPELISQITTDLDVRGIVGHGSHPDALERAGVGDAELLVAVTHSDETNMIAAQVAHSLFKTPMRIARVRAQAYLDPAWRGLFSTGNLPVDVVISPELEVGRSILQRVETPGAFSTALFAGGRVQLLGIRMEEESPVAGSSIDQIRAIFPDLKLSLCGVNRDGKLFVPTAADPLLAGDEIYISIEPAMLERALQIFGQKTEKVRRVVIIGAGNIGVYVARALERLGRVKVRLIEADKHRAELAADQLKKTVVLHGDGLTPELLNEAGADRAELVICVTNDDKVNLLSAVMAKKEGAGRTICLVNEQAFEPLRDPLDVDVFIDPRTTTVSTILQHIRRGRITGLQSIAGGLAEALEGVVLATSPLLGKSIDELELPDNVTVGALVQDGKIHMPGAGTHVKEGDRMLLFAEASAVSKVERLFRVSLDYF